MSGIVINLTRSEFVGRQAFTSATDALKWFRHYGARFKGVVSGDLFLVAVLDANECVRFQKYFFGGK